MKQYLAVEPKWQRFFFYIFIGVWLLYNVVLISEVTKILKANIGSHILEEKENLVLLILRRVSFSK